VYHNGTSKGYSVAPGASWLDHHRSMIHLYHASAAKRPNLFFKGEYHARFA